MRAAGPGPRPAGFGFLGGIRSVGSGVLGAGVFTYLFLSLAGRVLGPTRFAPVSTLWALVFIVGPGLFLPMQQELGRVIAARRADREGGHAVRRASQLAGLVAVLVMLGAIGAAPWMTRELFAGQWSLFGCFEASVAAYALSFIARGVFSGLGDFADFGALVAGESLARLALAAVLAAAGVHSAFAFGVAIAIAPLVSTTLVTRFGRRLRLGPGPVVSWPEMTHAFGWLVAGSLLAQFLANAGPIAVQVLATGSDQAEAGRFLSALVIARVTLYLFQAVQATILPNLAELATTGRHEELHDALRRLMAACGLLVVVSTVGALSLGPFVVRALFGPGFDVGARTMAMLAGASAVYVLAAALNGASIATAGHRLSAISWLVGCVAFGGGTLLSHDLFLRVELGYLLGSCGAAAVFVSALPSGIRRRSGQPGSALGSTR